MTPWPWVGLAVAAFACWLALVWWYVNGDADSEDGERWKP